jgi:signal transduction histidine kinase
MSLLQRWRSRQLFVPALVVALGVVSSIRQYSEETAIQTAELIERTSDTGIQLANIATDLALVAVEQAQSIRGLYESSSEVTKEEFAHFAAVMGDAVANRMAFAPRVPADELDDFVDNATAIEPRFELHADSDEPREVYWPLLFSSETDDAGFDFGFDFGSVPAIAVAIERSIDENRGVASDLVKLPGDDDEGDLVIVSAIEKEGVVIGAGFVTLRLDELLAPRAEQLLGNDVRVVIGAVGRPVAASVDQWTGTLDVAGQQFELQVELESIQRSNAAAWSLAFGISTTFFLGWLIHALSRRRNLKREIATLQDTLAEKDRFLAGVSHELRTPLTVVVGSLAVLDSDPTLSKSMRETLLEDVRVSAFELETLVEDYLTAARLTTGAITFRQAKVDLDVLVHRLLVGIQPTVLVDVEPLGSIEGDGLRIRQILRNVINNAKRHAASEIHIRPNNDEGRMVIEVLNDGDPIPVATAQRMFEPFFGSSTPGQPRPVGLGLSVSRDLAKRMGGDLTYLYEDGYVCFRLSLPAVDRSERTPDATRGDGRRWRHRHLAAKK